VKEGHIWIKGAITAESNIIIRRQINSFGEDVRKIIVHIDSHGGDVHAGNSIYNILKSSGKKIEVLIESECQSIATFIMLAAESGNLKVTV